MRGRPSQVRPQLRRGSDDKSFHLVDGLGAGLDGRVLDDLQHPDHLHLVKTRLGLVPGYSSKDRACRISASTGSPFPTLRRDNGPEFAGKVMDDYSPFILAHWLQRDMTSDSFIEVVQEAVDRTGMDQVPIEDRTRLLSDNGPGYVSRAFRDYLGMVGIKHILATPFHPQANGKLERYRQTLKRDVNQLPYEMPSDVLKGSGPEILRRRKEVQAQTIQRRRQHNRALRELARPQSTL